MRTLVDIPEDDLSLLNKISRERQISRAELVRTAISSYLEPHRGAAEVSAFGLWRNTAEDGVAYQERMREEW